jgi:hypothetical protein
MSTPKHQNSSDSDSSPDFSPSQLKTSKTNKFSGISAENSKLAPSIQKPIQTKNSSSSSSEDSTTEKPVFQINQQVDALWTNWIYFQAKIINFKTKGDDTFALCRFEDKSTCYVNVDFIRKLNHRKRKHGCKCCESGGKLKLHLALKRVVFIKVTEERGRSEVQEKKKNLKSKSVPKKSLEKISEDDLGKLKKENLLVVDFKKLSDEFTKLQSLTNSLNQRYQELGFEIGQKNNEIKNLQLLLKEQIDINSKNVSEVDILKKKVAVLEQMDAAMPEAPQQKKSAPAQNQEVGTKITDFKNIFSTQSIVTPIVSQSIVSQSIVTQSSGDKGGNSDNAGSQKVKKIMEKYCTTCRSKKVKDGFSSAQWKKSKKIGSICKACSAQKSSQKKTVAPVVYF